MAVCGTKFLSLKSHVISLYGHRSSLWSTSNPKEYVQNGTFRQNNPSLDACRCEEKYPRT